MNIRSNRARLIKMSILGQIVSPRFPILPANPHVIDRSGKPVVVPQWGSIVYNVRTGDPAFGWVGDNIEPGVAIKNREDGPNHALNVFACIGNVAKVMSGGAKGATGIVTGKSGRFAEHVIVDFPPEVLESLAPDDHVQIQTYGRGLTLPEHPGVMCKSIAPDLLGALDVRTTPEGALEVPVVATVPPHRVGAGAGLDNEGGALSIQGGSREEMAELGLADLRLGDLVAFTDYDSTYGHGYLKGGCSIGVVGHTDSVRAGFGPGVTILFAARTPVLMPRISHDANVIRYLPFQRLTLPDLASVAGGA